MSDATTWFEGLTSVERFAVLARHRDEASSGTPRIWWERMPPGERTAVYLTEIEETADVDD